MEHETYNMNYDSNWGSRYDRSNTEPNPEADIILLMGAIVFIVFFSILCGMCSYERNDEEMNIELIDKVKKKTTEYQKKEGEICSICLEDFQQKEKIIILECYHYYHSKCITEWLESNNSCPLCRDQL
ncbi:MAG: hypothetical protein CL470_08335 [Acidimicrobiaceae bacterium]|nr:hypothetical protein [Acidimicrobiaceae bacterium]|tara:strand:+ start:223 stop:606 length:384 start_codon:yes stop_codon:yes gene_type:complete